MNTNPMVCVTVTAPTLAELRQARDAAASADLVELRLDTVRDPSVAGALAGRRGPVILTCRSRAEGGHFEGSEEERRRILADALALGAEYVDVEWRAGFDELLTLAGGRRIVLSYHDFERMPGDLPGIARAMRSAGAEIIKIAGRARRLSDCIALMELGTAFGGRGDAVFIAMGEAGLVSRILAGRFGSRWTYTGPFSGIGQLTPAALLDEYRFRHISGSTRLYGIAGLPVSHSVSPAMHNAAFHAARMDAVYMPLPAADAEDFVRFAHAFGVKGASVTIPFKVPLFERVDEADSVARRIGAINTLRMDDGRWLGANTDAAGFLHPLAEHAVPMRGLRAAILGAGGSARAVAVGLASSGAEVTVYARELARAEEVALLVGATAAPWPPKPGSWDLLVNCTPIGMFPHVEQSPLPASALTGRWVYDLVYNPPVTQLLHDAELAGCRTIGGLDMLVAQAHEQFHWWTGMRPAAGVMRSAALRRLAEFASNENHVV